MDCTDCVTGLGQLAEHSRQCQYLIPQHVSLARPYYPIPPEGEWDLVFVWFHLRYYYYTRSSSSSSSSSSKGWSDFTLLLKLSQ